MKITEEMINNAIDEAINRFLSEQEITELAMKPDKMSDKYGEVVSAIIDNLVSICLYPKDATVSHWRGRIYSLCKRFIDLDIKPKNTVKIRYNALIKGVKETLNDDYSAILNHFKSVSEYYFSQPKEKRLIPIKEYNECYKDNKEKIINAIQYITKCVAEQNTKELISFMETF